MCERLDSLLANADGRSGFGRRETDPGRLGLESLLTEIGKLELLTQLGAAGRASCVASRANRTFPSAHGHRDCLGYAPPTGTDSSAIARLRVRLLQANVIDGLVELMI